MSSLRWAAWESNLVDQPRARYWQGHVCCVSYPAVGTATALRIPTVTCVPALRQSDMPKSCWGHQGGTFRLRCRAGPKEMHMQQRLLHRITSLVCSDTNRYSGGSLPRRSAALTAERENKGRKLAEQRFTELWRSLQRQRSQGGDRSDWHLWAKSEGLVSISLLEIGMGRSKARED